jgi:hypothetical protein
MPYFVLAERLVPLPRLISRHSPGEAVGSVLPLVVPEHKSLPVGCPLKSVALILTVRVPGEPDLKSNNLTLVILWAAEGVKVCAYQLRS